MNDIETNKDNEDTTIRNDLKHFVKVDPFHVHKLIFVLNLLDFCFSFRNKPKEIVYMFAHNRRTGLGEFKNLDWIDDVKLSKDRVYEYDPEKFRVPLITHRVWVTPAHAPREIMETKMFTEGMRKNITRTMKILDEALKNDPANKDGRFKWTHYFWVNDKKLIPKTIAYVESEGYQVREFKELKSMDATLSEAMEEYTTVRERRAAGAAADFARLEVLFEMGGFYMDFDFYLTKYSIEMLKIFDFAGFSYQEFKLAEIS